MDAIILELINEKLNNVRDEITSAINAHCADPVAHPHAHDMEVSAAVEEHLSNAAAEIEAALSAEETPENEPPVGAPSEVEEPPQPPSPPEPRNEEREPERRHPLHHRVG